MDWWPPSPSFCCAVLKRMTTGSRAAHLLMGTITARPRKSGRTGCQQKQAVNFLCMRQAVNPSPRCSWFHLCVGVNQPAGDAPVGLCVHTFPNLLACLLARSRFCFSGFFKNSADVTPAANKTRAPANTIKVQLQVSIKPLKLIPAIHKTNENFFH